MKITKEDLRAYCKYLVDEYKTINRYGGKTLDDLEQFCKEGKIKDIIYKNTSNESKAMTLDFYKDKIITYAVVVGKQKDFDLLDLDRFLLIFGEDNADHL